MKKNEVKYKMYAIKTLDEFEPKHDFKIGNIVKFKKPLLNSDIGKIFRVVDLYNDEIIFCHLITKEKEFGSYPFIPSILEKVNEKESRFITALSEDLEKI